MDAVSIIPAPPGAVTQDGIEVEWQFEAADPAVARGWLEANAAALGFALLLGAARDQTDIYLETDDWRFYRAGYALRLRRLTPAEGFEATLKALERAETGAQHRREISERLQDGNLQRLYEAAGGVGQRVRALAGTTALRPIFALQTHREVLKLEHEGRPAATVALDETRILLGQGQAPATLRRVEVEAASGEPSGELETLVEALRVGAGLVVAALSKYEAGLVAHGLQPKPLPELGARDILPEAKLGQVALAVMRRQWAAFLAHEPGARLGDDAEDVHAMRVATRRLRAALSLFADCVPARMARYRAELQWVATALGAVRDLDVQLERLQDWQAQAPPEDREIFEPLRVLLEAQRGRARKRLLAALDSRRFGRLVEAYTAMLQSDLPSRASRPAAHQPVLEAAPELIAVCYTRLRKKGDGLTKASPASACHALRIRGKRLRYAVEFFAEVYGEPARELARNLTALQDLLGTHQDAQVAMAQMRAWSEQYGRRLPPRTVFAMGEISQRYAQLAVECRKHLAEVYAGVRGKPWKRLSQAMEARRATSASKPRRRPKRRPAPAGVETETPQGQR